MSTLLNNRILRFVPGCARGIALAVAFRWMATAAQVILMLAAASALMAMAEGGVGAVNGAYLALTGLICVIDHLAFEALARQACAAAGADAVAALRVAALARLVGLDPDDPAVPSGPEAARLVVDDIEALRPYLGDCLPRLLLAGLVPLSLFFVLLPHSWVVAAAMLAYAAVTLACAVLSRSRLVMDLCAAGSVAAGVAVVTMQVAQGAVRPFGALAVVLLCPLFVAPAQSFARGWWACSSAPAAADRVIALLRLGSRSRGGAAVADDAFPKLHVDGLAWTAAGGSADAVQPGDVDLAPRHGRHFRAADGTGPGAAPSSGTVSFSVVGNGLVSLVGAGADAVARVLAGDDLAYGGSVRVCDVELRDLAPSSLHGAVVTLGADDCLLWGTVRSNLLIARAGASDAELLGALRELGLDGLVLAGGGLDDELRPGREPLARDRRRAVCLARAALCAAPVYLLDDLADGMESRTVALFAQAVQALAGHAVVVATPRAARELVAGAAEVMAGPPARVGALPPRRPDRARGHDVTEPIEGAATSSALGVALPVGIRSLDELVAAEELWGSLPALPGVFADAAGGPEPSLVALPAYPADMGNGAGPGDDLRLGDAARALASRVARVPAAVGRAARAARGGPPPRGADRSFEGSAPPPAGARLSLPEALGVLRGWWELLTSSPGGMLLAGGAGALSGALRVAVPVFATLAVLSGLGLVEWPSLQLAVGVAVACALLSAPAAQGARRAVSRLLPQAMAQLRARALAGLGRPLPTSAAVCFADVRATRLAADLERIEATSARLPQLASALFVALAVVIATVTQSPPLALALLLAYVAVGVLVPIATLRLAPGRNGRRDGYVALLAEALADAAGALPGLMRIGRARSLAQGLSARLDAFARDDPARSLGLATLGALDGAVALASVSLALSLTVAQVAAGALQPAAATVCLVAFIASLPQVLRVAADGVGLGRTLESAVRLFGR